MTKNKHDLPFLSWKVQPQVDVEEFKMFSSSIRTLCLKRLANFLQNSHLNELEKSWDPFFMHPIFSWFVFCYRVDANHWKEGESVAEQIQNIIKENRLVSSKNPRMIIQQEQDSCWLIDALRELGENSHIDFPKSDAFANALHQSLLLIHQSWPEAMEQIQRLIRFFVPIHLSGFRSASTTSAFGTVFLNVHETANIPFFAANILHEASHHSLKIKQSFGALLKNPNTLVDSPLRQDQRPVDGVLHAVFVLKRLVYFLKRLQDINLTVTQQKETMVLKTDYEARLRKGLVVLERQAIFTAKGTKLFQDLRQ